jgi:hypothetical protein
VDGQFDYAVCAKFSGTERCLAESFGRVSVDDAAPAMANAHLIAAAPDLFAAAVLAVSEADASIGSLPLTARDRAKDDGDGFAFNISGSTIKLLRDAIAKARGGT